MFSDVCCIASDVSHTTEKVCDFFECPEIYDFLTASLSPYFEYTTT